jgi:3-dehydroquinate synthetase
LSAREKKIGLAESLKHGLLENVLLFENTDHLLRDPDPNPALCFDIAIRTMDLKSRLLAVDPFEKSRAQILLYGHLHAHSLERYFGNGTTPHGIALYAGILLDLLLTQSYELYNRVLETVLASQLVLPLKDIVDFARLRKCYERDTKNQNFDANGRFRAIKVSSMAEYASGVSINYIEGLEWQIIESLYHKLRKDLS